MKKIPGFAAGVINAEIKKEVRKTFSAVMQNLFAKPLFLSAAFICIGLMLSNSVQSQNYTYTNESFEQAAWPTTDVGTGTPAPLVSATGTWKIARLVVQSTYAHTGVNALMAPSSSFTLITPNLPTGAGTVTFWGFVPTGGSNRTIVVTGSTDGGNNFSTAIGTTAQISKGSWTQYSFTVNNTAITNVQFKVSGGGGAYIDDIFITSGVLGTPPIITTTGSSAVTRNSATLTGTLSAPTGTQTLIESGIVWDTLANPTIALTTKFTGGPTTTGTITANTSATLNAAKVYHYRAYVNAGLTTYYGADLTFTTGPAVAPTITTNTVTGILSTKAFSGGNITDSGGAAIIAKGVCWSTGATPDTSNPHTIDGITAAPFTSQLFALIPKTNYCVRAYAINSAGISYGASSCFQTLDSVSSVYTTPLALDFGSVVIKSVPVVKSYTLYARKLTPAAGNITVTAPAGFLVSLSAIGTFTSSINVPYTGGVLLNTTIYVKMTTDLYAINNGVLVVHATTPTMATEIQNVALIGRVTVSPDNLSNSGVDFWTGFGYVGQMTDNKAAMSVYIAATEQDAVVTVDLPGVPNASLYGFPKVVAVPVGTVQEVNGFPTSTSDPLADAKLYYTGISNRAVHVTSDGAPIAVWTYTSQPDNSAAGCLNFPTNTWNSAYTVQAIGGHTNNSQKPNSFFFVIAKDDKTVVTITPSVDIVDSSANTIYKDNTAAFVKYPAGVPFNVTLNKGQVFNAMGVIQGTGTGTGSGKSFALDLSGTKVTTTCNKKIAVFGGNGRVLIDTSTDGTIDYPSTSGSDNMLQQMFPTVAWGKTYLTLPTKSMEFNYFRIYVQDPATIVTVNGNTLPTNQLVNNLYYQISGNKAYKIVGNKAISVTQFVVAGVYSTDVSANAPDYGNNGKGDPEMIILSPIQQSISKATVYAPYFKNGGAGGNYINVIIKKDGVKSFRIFSDTTKAVRADTASLFVGLFDNINPLSYKMFRDTNNLMVVDTGSSSFAYGAAYAAADSLVWVDKAFKVYPADTNYYFAKFKVPVGGQYTLTSTSTFNAISYGMDKGESYGFNAGTNINNLTTVASLAVQNPYGPQQSSATSAITTCLSVPFNFSTALTFRVDSLKWNFNSNPNLSPNLPVTQYNPVPDSVRKVGTDSIYYYSLKNAANQLVNYKFSALGAYPTTITAFSSALLAAGVDPCTVASDSIKFPAFNVNVVAGVIPDFKTNYTACQTDSSIVFTDLSKDAANYKLIGWNWDFGNTKTSTLQNPTVIYRNSGTYNVKLRAIDSIGCYYDSTRAFNIQYNSVAKFGALGSAPDTVCVKSQINFSDSSKTVEPGGTITAWQWNFGDGNTGTIAKPSKSYDPAGKYTVTLKVINNAGCTSPAVTRQIVVNANPRTDFVKTDSACLNTPLQFTASPIPNATNIAAYLWDFGDLTSATTASAQKTYSTANTFNVKLQVTDKNGCKGDTTKTVVSMSLLASPTVTMDSVSYNYMRFKWPAVTGAVRYQVSLDGGTTYTNPSSGAAGTTHVILGVQPNLTQNIIVKAFGLLSCQTSTGNATGNYPNPDIFVPNAFTPNGDGKNDVFKMYGNYVKSMDFKIFNQWGELIFQTNDPTKGWDGTSKGKQQPVGVYVYVLQTVDQSGATAMKKGSVNLIR